MADTTTSTSTDSTFIPPKPGDIELSYIKIVNYDQSEVKNITLMVREFNLYQSIYSNHLRADLVIEDALSLLTRLPIIGEEVVLAKFRTPSTSPDSFTYDWIELAMRVVRLDRLSPTNIRDAVYRIELVSYVQLINVSEYIAQAYGPSSISDMVKSIANDWLNIANTNLTIEETDGTHRFVIPGLRPLATMNFLANEAQSKKYRASDYYFFETHKGFNFVTASYLIDKDVKEQYYAFEQSRPSNSIPSSTTSSANTLFSSLNKKNPTDFRTMVSINFEKIFDVESQLPEGMYDNMTVYIDPLLQQYDVVMADGKSHFNYLSSFDNFKHIAKGKPGQTSTTTKAYAEIPKGGQISKLIAGPHMRLIPTNKNQGTDFGGYPRKRQDFLSYLVSARQQMRSIVCQITIPGDSDRIPGDLIYFELPEMGGTDDVIGNLNKYISGAYFVTSVRHKYTPSASLPFVTILECVKNSYEAEIANDKVTASSSSSSSTYNDTDAKTKAKTLMEKISLPAKQRL